MIGAVGTALSGFQVASKRVAVAADNIANSSTEGYSAKRIQQTSQAGGGVVATLREAPRELTAEPSVDVANELVGLMTASYDAKANLKTIKVSDDMQKTLLDILS